jgi:hypothetical protein
MVDACERLSLPFEPCLQGTLFESGMSADYFDGDRPAESWIPSPVDDPMAPWPSTFSSW